MAAANDMKTVIMALLGINATIIVSLEKRHPGIQQEVIGLLNGLAAREGAPPLGISLVRQLEGILQRMNSITSKP